MKNRFNFTITNHEARTELNLTMNEYAIADLIYHLSNNPESEGRWCYASKEKLGGYLGLSKQSAHKIITKLLERGLIERNESTKHLRTTKAWYDNVIIKDGKESLPLVKKVYSDGKESLLPQYITKIYTSNKEYIRKFNELFDTKYQPTKGREEKLKLRLKSFSIEEIFTAVEKLAASKFHRGTNDRGWVATPDFLLRSDEKVDEWLNKKAVKKNGLFELSENYIERN